MEKLIMFPENERGIYIEMLAMFRKARKRCKEQGVKIELCGHEKRWIDCFSGFLNKQNKYCLLFQFNVGCNTFGIQSEVNLNDERKMA